MSTHRFTMRGAERGAGLSCSRECGARRDAVHAMTTVHRLRICRAESGQWSGVVLNASDDEVARIDECETPAEVEDLARDTWPDIESEPSEEAVAFLASFAGAPNTDVDRVTLDVPPEFTALCAARGLTAAQVLGAFMLDLAELPGSNGSDERMRAAAWFDRVVWLDAGEAP